VARLRTLCWESALVELLTSRTVMEIVRLTRVGPGEIALHRDGISINSPVPRFANAVGAFDRERPPEPGSTAYKQMMSRFEGHSRAAMGFVWLSTPTARHAASGTLRSARWPPAGPYAAATQGHRARPADAPDEPGAAGFCRVEDVEGFDPRDGTGHA
jgi:hypothetical protein